MDLGVYSRSVRILTAGLIFVGFLFSSLSNSDRNSCSFKDWSGSDTGASLNWEFAFGEHVA